jgi:hypothetical protein
MKLAILVSDAVSVHGKSELWSLYYRFKKEFLGDIKVPFVASMVRIM